MSQNQSENTDSGTYVCLSPKPYLLFILSLNLLRLPKGVPTDVLIEQLRKDSRARLWALLRGTPFKEKKNTGKLMKPKVSTRFEDHIKV